LVRDEPKMLTEGWICERCSNPATNSAMIWKIFHDSRDIVPDEAISIREWESGPLGFADGAFLSMGLLSIIYDY
jgi:hypothetical protein